MTNQQNIATAQQKFVIQIDDKTLKRVKPHDRAELVQAYLELFSGFSWVNWTNGHSLGRAWQTAITQCGAFCESKNKKNPAAKYLNAACNGHRKYWSQVIMTHKNRENTINQKDEHIKKLREHGMRMIRQAMDKINLILARYNEYTLEISRNATATMETPAPAITNKSQNTTSPITHTLAQQTLPKTDATHPAPEHAMAQKQTQTAEITKQTPAIQKIAEPQRVAQPAQLKQAQTAEIVKQTPAVQKIAEPQRVAQPAQLKQAQTAEIVKQTPAVQKIAEPQRMAQPAQLKQAQTAEIAKPAQPKKPYIAPEISVRENQFAKPAQQTKTENKVATFTAAQLQIKRQINIFAFKNFNQRAA